MKKIIICSLWALLVLVVLSAALGFYAIERGWIGYMPPIEDLQNPISRFATQVYSADGKVLGTWNYNRENRIMVDYNQLSPALIQALVATEDVRFYEHSGIDFYALGRAIIKRGIFGQKSAGGGSTITQQLAKQLYSEKAHSVMERVLQKPIEWVIAVKLERNYTKDEIITMYLNYFDFLHNAVGIKTASNTYFSKEPRDLKTTEAAVLVGLCKNPSYFNPVRHPERSLERRNVVLAQMEKAGYISETERDKLSEEPLGLKFHVADHKDGIAQYFRDFLRRYMMAKQPERKDYPAWNMVKFHIDSLNWENDPLYGWCNKNRKKDGEPYNLYTDGLKVYTTIDSRMQAYAEKAVYEHVAKYLQPAFTKEKAGRKTAPFSGSLPMEKVQDILMRSVHQCDRYRAMKATGASEDEIMKAFHTKTEMTVFSYHGEDWRNTWDWPADRDYDFSRYFERKCKPQVKEILTQYGDLCLIWFDVPSTILPAQCQELKEMVRTYQPGCLINGRLGYGLGDYDTPGDNCIADKTDAGKLYETVGTMNDSWGYRPTDTHYKSVDEILAIKAKCASIGSNYMLNIGPDPLGRIPAAGISILEGLAAKV